MKRPLVWVAVSALTAVYGAVTGYSWLLYVFLIIYTGAVILEYYRNNKSSTVKKALKYCGFNILIGCVVYFSAYLYGTRSVSDSHFKIPLEQLNNAITKGVVTQVSDKEYGCVLVMSQCEFCGKDNQKVVITIYNKTLEDLQFNAEPGDYLEIEGDIKEIQGPRNEGEFDAKSYYGSLGIFYKGTADKVLSVKKVTGVHAAINKLKSRLNAVYEAVADEIEAGILKAIVLGDKDCLDEEIYELYKNNGIAHILAISGLHISFIGMMIYKLFKRYISGYVIPFSSAMIVLILYSVMTGNSVSAKRAVIMCVVSMGADVLGRTYDVLSALSLAVLLIVYENVFIIFNSGFQLSFGAIVGIACVYPAFNKLIVNRIDKMADRLDRKRQVAKRQVMKAVVILLGNLLGSISISLVTLPIIMSQYYQVPVYSILLNIIVIPLMALLLLCSIFVAAVGLISLPLATFFMGTVHYILKLYTLLCNWFDGLAGNVLVTGKPEFWDCMVYYILLAIFVCLVTYRKQEKEDELCAIAQTTMEINRYRKLRQSADCFYVTIVLIALLIILPNTDDELVVRMLDVGQGECIYVQYNNETYLFDGGSTDIKNVGERRIFPCLRANGVTCIDYVFISHADYDHISGILELFLMQDDTFIIKNLVLPDIKDKHLDSNYTDLISAAVESGVNVMYVARGAEYTAAGKELSLTCIHPTEEYDYRSSNDYSAVYRLVYDEFSMLFTGDVEEYAETFILSDEIKLRSAVLAVPHHGSAGSSSREFLKVIQPQYAVISCGIDNIYGHPHADTLDRLKEVGAKVYITSECGQITIKVGNGKTIIDTFL